MENMKRCEMRVGAESLKKVKLLAEEKECSQASIIRGFISEGLQLEEKAALENAPPLDLESETNIEEPVIDAEPEPVAEQPEKPESNTESSVEPENPTEETEPTEDKEGSVAEGSDSVEPIEEG